MTHALTRALNLFDSDSSASGDESAPSPSKPPRKCPRKSSLTKGILKPSVTKGSFE
jgi:hypothetical protein